MQFGPKIRRIRELFGHTQKLVAKYLGIHQTTYCRMEKTKKKEKIATETLGKLAELYGMELRDLLDDKFVFNIQEQNGDNVVFIKNYTEADKHELENALSEIKSLKAKLKSLESELAVLRAFQSHSSVK